jgi:hypothetical protein
MAVPLVHEILLHAARGGALSSIRAAPSAQDCICGRLPQREVVTSPRELYITGVMPHLDLSADEAAPLIKELHETVGNDRYPFSDRTHMRKAILARLRPEPVRSAASPEPRVYEPPSSGEVSETQLARKQQKRELSMCSNYPRWVALCDWQTLAAGVLAILAAVIGGLVAYFIARWQIREQQQQNAKAARAEQRSIATVLSASLGLIAADAKTAISKLGRPPGELLDAQTGTAVRHTIGKYAFDYLRGRIGHIGRENLVIEFLVLDRLIDQLWTAETPEKVYCLLDDLVQKADKLRALALGSTQVHQ